MTSAGDPDPSHRETGSSKVGHALDSYRAVRFGFALGFLMLNLFLLVLAGPAIGVYFALTALGASETASAWGWHGPGW
jgi:hypothetical protein